MKTTYIATYTYNAGLLGASKYFETEIEARQFEQEYKNMKDCDKYFKLEKVTVKGFLKKKTYTETLTEWEEL